ncbi:MAG TPA: cobalamin biosynthesis protein [Rhizobiales bacterium]|nr:cobalamin biosynthesis protein [Hyphomicrobiales bacterium]
MTDWFVLSDSYFAATFLIAFLALIMDALVGDPDWFWRRLPHPVVWIGTFISLLEKSLNAPLTLPPERQDIHMTRFRGMLMPLYLIVPALGVGAIIQKLLFDLGIGGILATGLIASVFIAQRSLSDHVYRVWQPLSNGDLNEARKAVSMIVGRDPEQLDAAGIARASIESTAENFSDGVVAPLFWLLIGGLPGLFAYKAINTADSMIGHKNERYQYFGWASAKLDDVVNLIPARISMILLLLGGKLRPKGPGEKHPSTGIWSNVKKIWLDAPKHRSPNAGWPEGAMAYLLNITLSGPRIYGDKVSKEPYVNETGRKDIGAREIKSAVSIYAWACGLEICAVGLGYAALLFSHFPNMT